MNNIVKPTIKTQGNFHASYMMNIVLTGFMGSGKSSIGIELSKRLGVAFIDTDKHIEKSTGMTINEIFKKHGEEEFRKLETQTIEFVSKRNCSVISTGGGVVLNPYNVELLRTNGKIFYLQVSLENIFSRLEYDNTRPLLQAEDKKKALSGLYNKRFKIYEETADYIIDANKSPYAIINEIISL